MQVHNKKDKDDFDRKSVALRSLAHNLATKYIQYFSSDFLSQVEAFIRGLEKEIGMHCLSYKGGAELISNEIEHLSQQDVQLTFNQARIYLIIEKEKENQKLNLVLKNVGFVAGGAQVVGGFGICAASLGVACAAYGTPMMLQGSNNVYENGYYLLFREDRSGTVREAYRYAASQLGYGNTQADFVYGAVDLAMSGYGATRSVLLPREKSWSLFRNISSDYIRGWQESTKTALLLDGVSSASTAWSMYQLQGGK